MAIKYLDSKRIRGSSTGTKTTAEFEETFSSTGHTSDDTTVSGWYANDILRLKYDATNNNAYFNASGAVDILYYDLQHADALNGSNANATNWTLRFKINMTTKSGSHNDGTQFTMGLVSHTGNVSRDFMGIFLLQAHSSGSFILNGTINNGYPQNFHGSDKRLGGSSQTLDLASGTDWWVDITRDGDDCITTIYEDEFTGTSYTNTQDVASIADLRYIHFGVYAGNTTFIGTIDDIKFYDGGMTQDEKATLVTPAATKNAGWTQTGSTVAVVDDVGIDIDTAGTSGTNKVRRLIGTTLSNTAWVCRFKLNHKDSGGAESPILALSANNTTGNDFWDDAIMVYANSSGSNPATLGASYYTSGGGSNGISTAITLTDATVYYVELIRTASDNVTISVFTGSDYSTGQVGSTQAINSSNITGIDDLITIQAGLGTTNGARDIDVVIQEIKIYNGVTSATGTPVYETNFSTSSDLPENTLFEETDTRKVYWLSDGQWIPTGMPVSASAFSNLTAWFDASDLNTVTKDGSNIVTQLDDKSGNGYNLTEPSSTAPLWVEAGQNGRNHIDFANTKRMRAQWAAKSQPVTICAVLRTPTNSTANQQMWDNYDNTEDSRAFSNEDTNPKLVAYAPSSMRYSQNPSAYSNTWTFFVITYNGSSSSMRINGIEKTTGNVGSNDSYGLTLSCGRGTFNSPGNIILGEFMEFDEALSASDITKINNYFAAKWGITIGS